MHESTTPLSVFVILCVLAGTVIPTVSSATGTAMSDVSSATGTAISDVSSDTGTAMSDVSSDTGTAMSDVSSDIGTAMSDVSSDTGTAMSDVSSDTGTAMSAVSSATGTAMPSFNSFTETAQSARKRQCGPCMCVGTEVDCSRRGLSSVPNTGLPVNATSLNLSGNVIRSLPAGPFANFSALTKLDLSLNNLRELSDAVFGDRVNNLQQLNLSGNYLELTGMISEKNYTSLPSHDRPFGFLAHLRALDLSSNQLRQLSDDVFVGLNSLQWLSVSNNRIPLNDAAYPQDVFAPFGASLSELRLEGNCNASASEVVLNYPGSALSHLTHLGVLCMDGLPAVAFSPGFEKLKSLHSLGLTGLGGGVCYLNTLANHTFTNLPASLLRLNISNCNISEIQPDAFGPLQSSLTTLDLSHNTALGFDTLGEAMYGLRTSGLRELHINSIVPPFSLCVTVTCWNTRHFRSTRLERIYAQNNRLEVFGDGALGNMPPTLTYANLNWNRLTFGSYFRDMKHLVNLTEVEMDGHQFALDFPHHFALDVLGQCKGKDPERLSRCRSTPVQLIDHLTSWEEDMRTHGPPQTDQLPLYSEDRVRYTLPPKLTTVSARYDQLFYKLKNIKINPENSLTTLDLSRNLFTNWGNGIEGLGQLTTLNLGYNLAYKINHSFFQSFPSLVKFYAGRNFLRIPLEHDERGEFFDPLCKLEELQLSENYLNVIPEQLFQGLVSLRILDLSKNEIDMFAVNISHMRHLELVNLSYNNIHCLLPSVMSQLDAIAASSDVFVDLTFNPIACTCEHIDFLTWMHDSRVNFTQTKPYTCQMSNGSYRNISNIFNLIADLHIKCTDMSGILVGAASSFFCLLLALLSALGYRYRWKLRYLYYATRLAYKRVDDPEDDDFQFDAFVSYASEDEEFVRSQLMEQLERRAGLRLNVHQRDFVPGRPIACNIVDAVQSSRRTLVVLSRQLLESDWCQYEMQVRYSICWSLNPPQTKTFF